MSNTNFKWIAHRGVSSEAPENTLIAFRIAIEMGVDFFELDVQLSSDGIPIVIHDSSLERTTNFSNPTPVSHLSASELKALDAGSWFDPQFHGEQIPTLQEVLDLPRKQTGIMLEIKITPIDPEKIVQAVLQVLSSSNISSKSPILIASFSRAILEEVRKAAPDQPLIGLADDESGLKALIDNRFNHLCPEESLLSPKVIKNLRSSGLCVWTFTVDDPKRAEELRLAGIDGIVTNRPRELKDKG